MKHGMQPKKKRATSYFSWLDSVVFWKNGMLMKESHDKKRAIQCADNKVKSKKFAAYNNPASMRRLLRGK